MDWLQVANGSAWMTAEIQDAAGIGLAVWRESIIGLADVIAETWRGVWDGTVQAYHRAPALVLGLGVALVLPPLAVFGALLHAAVQQHRERRDAAAGNSARTIPVSAWQQRAFLSWDRQGHISPAQFILTQELVRIGRADDNDVCLPHNSIHRYHAVVERSPEMHFILSDLSGASGNGTRIGGQDITRRHLAPGDMIEIGRFTLRFDVSATDQQP